MRIEELFGSKQLNEGPFGPYGVTQRMKDATVAKAKGVFGGGQREQGNMAVGEKANQLYKDFKRYIGQVIGPGHKYVEAQHLINWMKTKKLDSSVVDRGPEDFITPGDAQKLIMASARKTAGGTQQEQPQAAPAQQAQGDQAPAQARAEPKAKESGDLKSQIASIIKGLSPEEKQALKSLL